MGLQFIRNGSQAQTISAPALSAFHNLQLLSADEITGLRHYSGSLRARIGAGTPVVWMLRRWLCGDAGARAFAHQ